ncbi:hypothetical protein B4Q13_16250, partial [Lacticaseibacillus rhamnosus]
MTANRKAAAQARGARVAVRDLGGQPRRPGHARAPGAVKPTGEVLLKRAVVAQPGQRVGDRDLGQAPGDVAVLSFADSDLAGLAAAWTADKAALPRVRLAHLRDKLGDEIELFHDVHERLTPIQAARLARELEPYHLFFLEDCLRPEPKESFRVIRQHPTTPL